MEARGPRTLHGMDAAHCARRPCPLRPTARGSSIRPGSPSLAWARTSSPSCARGTGPRGRRIGQARTDHFGPFVARRECRAASQGNPSRKTRYWHKIVLTIHTKFMRPVYQSVRGVRTAAPERSGGQMRHGGVGRRMRAWRAIGKRARRTTAPSEAREDREWALQAPVRPRRDRRRGAGAAPDMGDAVRRDRGGDPARRSGTGLVPPGAASDAAGGYTVS